MGELKMDGLPHLRVCVLKAITADRVAVPKACRLHVDVSAGLDMQCSIWRGILTNIYGITVDLPRPDTATLNLLLTRTENPLQDLQILNIQFVDARVVFDLKSFARVEKLRISGMDLDLRLPAGVCWEALQIDATGKLVLDFEDLEGFPKAVPRFAARFGVLRGTHALELCTALAANGIKMAPKKSKRELGRADLPMEVWARIAAHMSLQDWAKASGTCRSTRAVRLKNLNIKHSPAPGVQWASRMLDGAEALCLSVDSLQQVAQGASRGLYSIKQIRQLIIDAKRFSDPALPCLPWLLAQASKLEVLVTPAGIRPWFPALATLKHLDLGFHKDAGNFCEAVLDCTCLETLSLRFRGKPGSNISVEMGHLQIENLPKLRVVVLKGIISKSISVPKACQLHIAINICTDMQKSILANIHGMDVKMPHLDGATLDLFLKRTLEPLQNLQILHIQVQCWGSDYGTSVLDLKAFARIEHLRISGMDLTLRFPAGVCWNTIEVVASNKLVLDFEDLNDFTKAVHSFSASYNHLCSTQALELCTVLAMSEITCAFQKEERGKSMFWFPAEISPSGCWCGACLDCLVASGQAVATASEAKLPRPDVHYYFRDVTLDENMANEDTCEEEDGLVEEEDEMGEGYIRTVRFCTAS
ncbi:hypothetical protein COCOBI_11-4860 [Coccomyxa sp. Obi]|nr:hypothetical protein COCOBI_11-4860 [Coccomyxa sp. Obi]